MDIIDTNPYENNDNLLSGNTYGVQNSIKRYQASKERERRAKESAREEQLQLQTDVPDSALDMSDPLYTNRIQDSITANQDTVIQAQGMVPNPVLRPGIDVRSGVAMEPVALTPDRLGPIGLRPVIDPVTGAKAAGRQIYERVRLISISSRYREKWEIHELPVDPVSCQYTRLTTDERSEEMVCRYTSDILNAEYYWDAVETINQINRSCELAGCNPICQYASDKYLSIPEPFFTKDCKIFMKKPIFPDPSNYTIFFSSPFSYIREISLVASEIPNPFRTIGLHNNKIMFHIKDANTGRALPFRSDYRGIPFYLIELTPGNYSMKELLHHIESLANEALDEKACFSSQDNKTGDSMHFKICYNETTDIIRIDLVRRGNYTNNNNNNSHSRGGDYNNSKPWKKKEEYHHEEKSCWVFHWRFWCHWSIPEERTLFRMLGFAKASLKDRDGSDSCVSSSLLGGLNSKKLCRPFARPNLFPETFFYLIIDNLDLGNDSIYSCNKNVVINNIFAKIQVKPKQCCEPDSLRETKYLYNTAITATKIYFESPLRTLDKLEIRFVDEFGDPVDFQNLDHSLTFRITQYVDYLVDTNFDSTRGI
jgi:hypothetical protein